MGRGGGGRVFRARQASTGRTVAVKILGHDPDAAAPVRARRRHRFRREMQICGQLEHPDVVRLIDHGVAGDSLYSVFEFVTGQTLAQVLRQEGALTLERARQLLRQVLDVLEYAHARGVIHRDIKPSNIMVVGDDGDRIKVLDFGVSAVPSGTSSEAPTRLTLSNEMVGTPSYAAPEQLRGDLPTTRTDIYAWGLVLLECVTGENPMAGETLGDVFARQLSPDPVATPPQLREHPLGSLLRWVLEKDATRRASSAAEVLARLDAIELDSLAGEAGYLSRPRGPARPRDTIEARTEVTAAVVIEAERRQVCALCCRLRLSSDAALPEIGAALSGLLETLQSQAPVEQKADEFRPLASTPAELDVLDYRICLEFGEGVLDAADFTQWREQIRPMLATGMRSVSELTARAPSA